LPDSSLFCFPWIPQLGFHFHPYLVLSPTWRYIIKHSRSALSSLMTSCAAQTCCLQTTGLAIMQPLSSLLWHHTTNAETHTNTHVATVHSGTM
jgi:hypothetical protein